jgi:hypothetical protein
MWGGGRSRGSLCTNQQLSCGTILETVNHRKTQEIQCTAYCITTTVHCKENPIYVFLFWEMGSLSPNFHIHVSVSDLFLCNVLFTKTG